MNNKNNNKENKDSIRIVKIISEDGNSNNNVSGENTQNNMENYNSNEEVNNYNSPNPYNITNNSNQFHDVDMEAILDVMGCRTRREIINLLREEPRFVSEISQELEVGQKAIIEHLRAMEEIGILESSFRKIVRGRPRKYYDMPHDFAINITITENSFDVNISEDILNLKQLPSGDEWSKLLELERRIDQGHWEAVEELKSQIRLYDNLKSRAEYILERTQRR
jgi:ArsR family transcriptional regulator